MKENISDDKAKEIVEKTFELIKAAKSIDELNDIFNAFPLLKNYALDNIKYPKIEFQISVEEIKALKEQNFLTNEDKLSKELATKSSDTLIKLLYALAWKNGDLVKIRHIIKGILSSNDQDIYEEDAIVFYEFGKYISQKSKQLIIDQHTIRAFMVYRSTLNDEISECRKLNYLSKQKHEGVIKDYHSWFQNNIQPELMKEDDYTYHLDKVLFALGKAIKFRKTKSLV